MAALGVTSDFSSIAARYDATRDVPPRMLAQCYRRFVERGLLPARGLICDAGCGTGQASAPLLELGYRVQGFDISPAMLDIARAKLQPGMHASYTVADARALPAADASFDAVVVSKLFQHIDGWQAAGRELLRVLKSGGCLFHINERGAFANAVRKYFGQRADALGYTIRMLGRHERPAMLEFFLGEGCQDATIDISDLKWRKQITYGEILDQFHERLFAEFWYLPDEVYRRLLEETAAWVEIQPQGRATVQHLAPYMVADIFRKF